MFDWLSAFFTQIRDQPVQLLIPPIAAIVGWITNVLAVKMMFYPVDFVGFRPYLGWQGIIPANALAVANRGLKLVTARLLDIRELFQSFDGQSFLDKRETALREATRRLVSENAERHFKAMWDNLADNVREQVYDAAYAEVSELSVNVLDEAARNIHDLLHLDRVLNEALKADKELMNRIFMRVGSEEFKFIERSGLYFGFAFGLVQFLVWVLYPAWWILPFFGFLVGYATNWVALKLVFQPRLPVLIGPLTIHGLFHRRQGQIALELSDIMTKRIISSENLFKELSSGTSREKLLAMVKRRVDPLMDKLKAHPMAAMVLQSVDLDAVQGEMFRAVEQEMFRPDGLIFSFADKADEIRLVFRERMAAMKPEAFEDVLRPAFQQDEWKLILAGAVLGLGAGFLQLVTLFAN